MSREDIIVRRDHRMAEEEKKDPITMVEEGEETVGAPGEEGSAPAAVVVDGATSAGGCAA